MQSGPTVEVLSTGLVLSTELEEEMHRPAFLSPPLPRSLSVEAVP